MTITPTDQPPGKWDLTCLYGGDDDPQIAADIATIEGRVSEFATQYGGLTVRSIRLMRRAIRAFEKLQRIVLLEPTIDDQLGPCKPLYYWMLRDASESTDATRAKVQELAAWHRTQLDKVAFFFQLLDGMSQSRRRALLRSLRLRPYRAWLTQRFMLPIAAAPTPQARAAATAAIAQAVQQTGKLNAAISNATAMVLKDGVQQSANLITIAGRAISSNKDEAASAIAALPALYTGLEGRAFVELTTALAARTAEAGLLGGSVLGVRCATDTLSTDTLDGMIEAVMAPDSLNVAHRYYALKAALDGGKLPFARRRVMYGAPKQYTWPEALDLLRTFFARISPALAAEFERALANGYIDAESNRQGKIPVTCCYWAYGLQPMLVINFTGDMTNISQIAHEFAGHYMAALAVSRQRNGLGYNTKIPLAETHGVSWQLLVPWVLADKLGTDAQSELAGIMYVLETLASTCYLQIAGTKCEQRMYAEYQNGTLTLDGLESFFADDMHQLFGDAVMQDELSKLNWITWSQLRQGFYNYSYAMAAMIAIVLRERYMAKPASTVQQINRLMSAGCKDTLANIYREVGIDLGPDLWRQGINAFATMLDRATELASQLDLIPTV